MATVRVIAGYHYGPAEFAWRKSSWSGTQGCVEVASQDSVFVRDTQNRCGGILVFPRTSWNQFLGAAVSEQSPFSK